MYPTGRSFRNPFTEREDDFLMKYIAKYNPQSVGRTGVNLYKSLVENADNKWTWARTHTWQSWRERYKKNQDMFDRKIKKYIRAKSAASQEKLSQLGLVKVEGAPRKTHRTDQDSPVRKPANAFMPKAKEVAVAYNERREAGSSRVMSPDEYVGKKTKPKPKPKPIDVDEEHLPPKTTKPPDGTGGQSPKLPDNQQPRIGAENAHRNDQDSPPRKSDNAPVVNAPKVKEVAVAYNARREPGSSRQTPPAEDIRKKTKPRPKPKPIDVDEDDDHVLVMSKSSKPPNGTVAISLKIQDSQGGANERTTPVLPAPDAPTVDGQQTHRPAETTTTEVAEGPETDDDDLMHELFGSYPEESQERTEEHVPDSQGEYKLLDTPIVAQSIYPKLPSPHAEDEYHIPGAFEGIPLDLPPAIEPPKPDPPTVTQPVVRPVLKKLNPKPRKPVPDDPYGTPSESSSPPTRPRYGMVRTAGLPVLVDNGFTTTLKRPRRSSTGDGNTTQWPPKRVKTTREASRAKEPVSQAYEVNADHAPPAKTRKDSPAPVRRHVYVNAVASSSKTMLPPAVPNAANFRQPVEASIVPMPSLVVVGKKMSPMSYPPPAKALSDNDPFTEVPVSERNKGKDRTEAVTKVIPPRKIDLHKQSLKRRLTLSITGSRSSSHTASSYGAKRRRLLGASGKSLRKSLIGIGPTDPKFELVVTAVEEITQTLTQMAAMYGVAEEIAQATYVKTRSLEKTRFILQQLRDAMAEKEKAIYAAMPELASKSDVDDADDPEDEDSDEEVPEGLVVRSNSKSTQPATLPSKTPVKSPRRGARPSLSIRPIVDDRDRIISAEYLPPDGSRAGQFARLMKQGRVSEAVEREKRRVSGVFVPATQNTRQFSPPSPDASPTPQSRTHDPFMEVDDADFEPDDVEPIAEAIPEIKLEVIDDDDDDDMYVHDDEMDHEADDESEKDKMETPSSPSYPSATRTLIKRLSGGRQNKPEFLAKAQRYRDLALAVDTETDGEMRQFEYEHNKVMMKLWTVDLVREIVEGYPKVR